MNDEKKAISVFANRNYRFVFFGALISELGALLYSFAVGFYILQISGNNAFLQGLYLALCGVALLLFTPVGGVLGDRFNKAKIMYVCDYIKGGMIILATVLMMILPSPKAHIVILFILGILGNVVSGIFNPAAGAMLPNIVEPQQLQQANAYFSIKSSMESILGVVLAGVLYAVLPLKVLFPAVGACFIASGISEMLIRYDHTPSAEPITLRLALSDMKEGILYLKGQKAIMAIIGAALFIGRLRMIQIPVDVDIPGPAGPEDLLRRIGIEPAGVHVPYPVGPDEIEKPLFKAFAGIDKSGSRGEARTGTDHNGVGSPDFFLQPFQILLPGAGPAGDSGAKSPDTGDPVLYRFEIPVGQLRIILLHSIPCPHL